MVVIGRLSPPLGLAAAPLPSSFRPLRILHASSQIRTSDSIFWAPALRLRNRTVAFRTNSSRGPEESGFVDENGVVDDMDGYLNYLSLEYDSVWDTKPSWCQPWTIALTGVSVVGLSWIIFKSIVITTMASLLIGFWWYIFLYSYPKQYSDMIAERRKKVATSVEDTFGMRKSQ